MNTKEVDWKPGDLVMVINNTSFTEIALHSVHKVLKIIDSHTYIEGQPGLYNYRFINYKRFLFNKEMKEILAEPAIYDGIINE